MNASIKVGPEPIRWLSISAWRDRPVDVPSAVPVTAVMPWLNHAAAQQSARLMVARAGAPLQILAVHDDLRIGPIAIWNELIRHVHSPYFIYCAEDAFAGRNWLRFALQAMDAPGAGLLAFNDGKWFGQLAAFGMVRRRWLDPLYGGLLFHPEYVRHYSDVELSLIARYQKALVYHPNSLLVEVDHDKDGKQVDAADRVLFRLRADGGFDGRVKDDSLVRMFV